MISFSVLEVKVLERMKSSGKEIVGSNTLRSPVLNGVNFKTRDCLKDLLIKFVLYTYILPNVSFGSLLTYWGSCGSNSLYFKIVNRYIHFELTYHFYLLFVVSRSHNTMKKIHSDPFYRWTTQEVFVVKDDSIVLCKWKTLSIFRTYLLVVGKGM